MLFPWLACLPFADSDSISKSQKGPAALSFRFCMGSFSDCMWMAMGPHVEKWLFAEPLLLWSSHFCCLMTDEPNPTRQATRVYTCQQSPQRCERMLGFLGTLCFNSEATIDYEVQQRIYARESACWMNASCWRAQSSTRTGPQPASLKASLPPWETAKRVLPVSRRVS